LNKSNLLYITGGILEMDRLSLEQAELIVKTMADTAIKNEAYFSGLDGVTGDADFGVSLAGGFKAVLNGWDGFDHSNIGGLLINVASAVTGTLEANKEIPLLEAFKKVSGTAVRMRETTKGWAAKRGRLIPCGRSRYRQLRPRNRCRRGYDRGNRKGSGCVIREWGNFVSF
jgi:hypothetical protein